MGIAFQPMADKNGTGTAGILNASHKFSKIFKTFCYPLTLLLLQLLQGIMNPLVLRFSYLTLILKLLQSTTVDFVLMTYSYSRVYRNTEILN